MQDIEADTGYAGHVLQHIKLFPKNRYKITRLALRPKMQRKPCLF